MAYIGSFDANTVEPADFSALPAGDYVVLISSSEWKDSKSGGQYLALTLQVLEGAHAGRFLWHNLNLNHSNAQASEIAYRELSAICRAVGRFQINDSEELYNIPLIVKVAYVPPKDDGKGGQWPEKNQIKQWRPMNGVTAAPASTPAPAAKAPPAPPKAPPTAKVPPAPKAPPKAAPAPAPAPASASVAGKPWGKAAPAPVTEVADDDIDF